MKEKLVFLGIIFISIVFAEHCYSTDEFALDKQASQYGTKTAYAKVKGSPIENDFQIDGYSPSKVWLISRHGTRYPAANNIKGLKDLVKIRAEILEKYEPTTTTFSGVVDPYDKYFCDEDLNMLKIWQINPNITDENASQLQDEGLRELKTLGSDFKQIFAGGETLTYTKEEFTFMHTKKPRTKDSYKAFVEELFGKEASDQIKLPSSPEKETLLKPYSYCDRFEKETNYAATDEKSEYIKFKKSPIYRDLIKDVSKRFKFQRELSDDELENIWSMCRYEQAWEPKEYSPWCSAFTSIQVDVLEYALDLKYYYSVGEGSSVSANLTCEAFSDMLNYMQSSSSEPRLVAYFTHSNTVNLILTTLQAFVDKELLKADNFNEMDSREFRISSISPFATNLMIIKYQSTDDTKDDFNIAFWHNQKKLKLKWCDGTSICTWSQVENMFKHFQTEKCEDIFCPSSSVIIQRSLKMSFVSVVLLLSVYLF